MFGRKKGPDVKSQVDDGSVVVTFNEETDPVAIAPQDAQDIQFARSIATGPRPDLQAREIAGAVDRVARKILGFG